MSNHGFVALVTNFGDQTNQSNTLLNHGKDSTNVSISFKNLPTNLKNKNIDVNVFVGVNVKLKRDRLPTTVT